MSEAAVTTTRQQKLHYRGRGGQVIIYLGKLLRGFVYQNDWIVMPMAALIAGLVAMVVRNDFFVTMEGTLKGAFALTCVSIWNGCFNSIQVVCRERDILKREHRSGLHITAYVFSHMVYQALLCLFQTVIMLLVCSRAGIKFPDQGLFTPWLIVDLGFSVFLITYASDMLSLWVSSVTTSTTMAMTVMPFVLIFQLVFSGGIFTLPRWADKFSAISISNYGLKCINSQANYNGLPMVTGWYSVVKVENQEINTTVTLGQVMDFLQRDDISPVHDFRAQEYRFPTMEEILAAFKIDPDKSLSGSTFTLGQLLKQAEEAQAEEAQAESASGETAGTAVTEKTPEKFTAGEVIDVLAKITEEQGLREEKYNFSTTVGQLLDLVGREKAEDYIKSITSESAKNTAYDNTRENIVKYWIQMFLFVGGFALLSVIFLEFIDKDKR